MGSNSAFLELLAHMREGLEESTNKKVEPDKPKYQLEGNVKWLLDENGNYTGEGICPDGHIIQDLVYRPPKINLYKEI